MTLDALDVLDDDALNALDVDGIARARFYRSEAIGSARDASRR